ncbi:MAG: hypothetical protein WCP57_01430 [Bacteroidota bacterium]
MKKYIVTVICLLIFYTIQAQVTRKYSNDFMSIGVGARGLAMSNAQVAGVSDITAGYYNPAGLVYVNNNIQLGAMHAELFAGISKYDFVSFAVPFADKTKTVGFTFLRYGVDNIPNTLNLYNADGSIDYNNIRSFSVGSYGLYIHYAQKITAVKKGELSVGVSPKIVYNKMSTFANSVGFGIDVGIQYRIKNWRIGFMGRDLTSTFNAWKFKFTDEEKAVLTKTGNEIPLNTLEITLPRLWFGLAYEYKLKKIMKITPELNFDLTTDGKRNVILPGKPISLDMNFGLELSFVDIVYLRTGFGNVQKSTDDRGKKITTFQPNIGAGLGYKGYVRLDYAYTNIGESTGGLYSHVISLQLGINKKIKKTNPESTIK